MIKCHRSASRRQPAAYARGNPMLAFRLSALVLFAATVHIAVAEEVTLPAGYVPVNLVTDGATIHVAPGRYKISTPLSLTKAVELVGDNADPSRVVVSNTANVAWGNTNHRCILVNHANARVSGMTFENGKDYGNGGNVRIDTNGGVVTNCVSVSNVDSNGTVRAFAPSQVSRTSHCAFDAIAGETTIPEGMPKAVTGTAESFFNDFANGDYTPKAE